LATLGVDARGDEGVDRRLDVAIAADRLHLVEKLAQLAFREVAVDPVGAARGRRVDPTAGIGVAVAPTRCCRG
jgi:hypothetical protein